MCFLSVFLPHVLAIKNNLPVYLMIPCNYCTNPEPVAQIMKYKVSLCAPHAVTSYYTCMYLPYVSEVESRAQGSRPRPRPRPRTQKKSEAKDSFSEDRHSRGQGQECSRPRPRTKDTSASALQKKRSSKKFLRRSQKKKKKKRSSTEVFQAIPTKKRFPKNF